MQDTWRQYDFTGALNVLTLGSDYDPDTEPTTGCDFARKYSKASRRPPLTPQRFGDEMKMREARAKERGVKLFTNGKDQPFVMNKYDRTFPELVATEQMVFVNMNWGPQEVLCLAEVLQSCKALKTLDLAGNQLGDLGAEELATGLCALTNLELLHLGWNQIGDLGAEKLATGLCTLTNLNKLLLDNNTIGDLGAKKISDVLPYMEDRHGNRRWERRTFVHTPASISEALSYMEENRPSERWRRYQFRQTETLE